MIDSTTVTLAAKILSLNPSWGMVLLVLFLGVAWVIVSLSKNTTITKAILGSHSEVSEVVKQIRSDQIKSNAERREQGKRLDLLETDVSAMKKDIALIKTNCGRFQCDNTSKQDAA